MSPEWAWAAESAPVLAVEAASPSAVAEPVDPEVPDWPALSDEWVKTQRERGHRHNELGWERTWMRFFRDRQKERAG